jgi:hypothetical protein
VVAVVDVFDVECDVPVGSGEPAKVVVTGEAVLVFVGVVGEVVMIVTVAAVVEAGGADE